MIETRDRAQLEGALRREPVWAGYALGDLDPPHWERARWFAEGPAFRGLLLLYDAGGHSSVMTFGDPAAAAEVLRAAPLPARFHAHLPAAHLDALAPLLAGDLEPYLRLGLRPEQLRDVPAPDGVEVVELVPADASEALALYTAYPENWFDPARLGPDALYLGLREAGRLVAAAGTHVLNPRTRVAAVGDVVTAADRRGRGLGAALTAALCRRLFERADLVVLNVAEANSAARRAYARVGFGDPVPHVEGHEVRRS